MPIVLNEVKQAQYIIKKGEVGNKPTSTLALLAKYYRQKQELSKEQTFQKLNAFMQKNYKNYNSAAWENTLEDISNKAAKYSLREIDSIGITQSELDKISQLSNIKYRKLQFTMLCYAKLYNTISKDNNGWVNTDIKELFRTAGVSVKYKNDKFLTLNDLEQSGFIKFSKKNDNLNLQITFVDMAGQPVLSIDDFRELGYEYLNYTKQDNFIRCSECGRLAKQSRNNKSKYCTGCKQDKQKEWQRAAMQRSRKKCEVLSNACVP